MRNTLPCLLLVLACADRVPEPASGQADTAVAAAPAEVTDSGGVKACDLMTVDAARRITGIELAAGVTTNDYMGSSQCRFDRADGSRTGIMIALHRAGDIENYRKVPGSTEVTAVGDAAIWNPQTNQLAVKSDSAVFSISFLFSPAQRAWAIDIARAALPHLETNTQ